MVTNSQDDAATLAMLKMMAPMVDDPRYAYEVRDALDTQGSRDGNGGVRLHAGAAPNRWSGVMTIHPDTIITAAEIGCAVGAVCATFVLIMLAIGVW